MYFKEAENTTCFTCKCVLDEQQPVLYVTHDNDDGSWQFLCGKPSHEANDGRIISLLAIVQIDQSLNALYEMPLGVGAEREAIGKEWKPFRIPS